jgi:hypothetical protein
MEHIADQRPNGEPRAAGVEVDIKICGADMCGKGMGDLLGGGAIRPTGASAGQIETIFPRAVTAVKGGFVDHGDER